MLALEGADPGEKTFRRGTHRTVPPEQTVARLRSLMPRFGITRIANLTGLDRIGVPVVMVCRPNARSSAVFHGKGVNLAAAKASGLMEAAETWHAEQLALPLRLASAAELAGQGRIVDVDALPLAPSSRLHPHLPMLWVEGTDLASGESVWVPHEMVHADCTQTDLPGSGCFAASTNGLASGNHPLEATVHAICEVVERDATSLWHRRPPEDRTARRIDLASVTDEDCRHVLALLEKADIEVGVWETTTDVGIPAFQCIAIDRTDELAHVGEGAGCHAMPEIALFRALSEAVQVRTTYIAGAREDIVPDDYHTATLERRVRRARRLLARPGPMRPFRPAERMFDTFEAELAWLVERLSAAGIRQVAAVNLTRADIGLCVVRVVIPGLEGSDHDELYVPGCRARALAEAAA